MITVWYNGSAMAVSEAAAKMLNIKNGHTIRTEEEFWKILSVNSEVGLATCEGMKRAEENKN